MSISYLNKIRIINPPKRLSFVLCVLWMAVAAPAARAGDVLEKPCRSCESLKELLLPDVRIDSVSVLARPDICVLTGVIGREINFELLLPAQWNGRFVMGGGGGFVGYIMNRARNMAFDGFATVGTDTGHKGTDAGWGLNDMERQLNFGHAAVHRTAEVAKAVIRHYYASPPRYSYFIGLSRGGGQAMMEAQRYPHDFDGIVAGAPAFNWVGMATKFNLNTRVLYGSPENRQPVITRDNLRVLQQHILAHCDAYDGVRDSMLSDPIRCDFNLENLPRCKSDIPGKDCFTGKQIDALISIYAAVRDGDKIIHSGFPFGGEDEKTGWFPSVTGPIEGSKPYPTWQAFYGMETFKYLVFNDSEWRYDRYDWQRAYRDTRYAAAYLNAAATDYSAFKARGGKMILYQGWADPLISALDLVRHYEEAVTADTHLGDHIRLFMLPGVTHTGGNGPGKADWFRLISDWVEKDTAPERVIVSKTENGKVVMTRPVFPYPRVPVYDGTGDPDRESSFK